MSAIKPIHLLRYGLPLAIAVAGVVFICIDPSQRSYDLAAGITLIGIAIIVLGVNVYARLSIISQDDRDREEQAREHFARTGHWPPESRGRPPATSAPDPANAPNPASAPVPARAPAPADPPPASEPPPSRGTPTDPHADPRPPGPSRHPAHRGHDLRARRRPRR